MNNSNIIEGGHHSDSRGTISFVNDFDMSQVKRFYVVKQPDTKTIRAWRGHRIEQRWFHAISGEFLIRLVKIDNWENPSRLIPIEEYLLSEKKTDILYIPAGYANSVQAIKKNSKLLNFSDHRVENAAKDNYLFPTDYFNDLE